jgi:DNA-binding NtrC family response regulator
MKGRILLVDDEEIVIRSCQRILRDDEYRIDIARDGLQALERVNENEYDVLILDIKMPKMDGIEVLRRVKEARPDIDVIMITGLHDISMAVQAMKLGALDYLPKPFEPEDLQMLVARAFDRRALLQGSLISEDQASTSYHFENIIGSSAAMQKVFRLIAHCAPTNSTVMLRGESGTGKELVARAIHYNSLRKNQPFVPVDCTSLSEGLLESELFGHVKGSFTGAVSKAGLCSWMRLVTSRSPRRPSFYDLSKNVNSRQWETPAPRKSIFGWLPPPTRTSRAWWLMGNSGMTSITGSISFQSRFRH